MERVSSNLLVQFKEEDKDLKYIAKIQRIDNLKLPKPNPYTTEIKVLFHGSLNECKGFL